MTLNATELMIRFAANWNGLADAAIVERRLGDLRGIFADVRAYEAALAGGNPIIYTVQTIEPASGEGDLHLGFGTLMPGKVGDEYFMTKGHLHSWRPAAEIYIGISGRGGMLLESEADGSTTFLPLDHGHSVYVPGYTAHRTVNTGTTPLTYLGIYPAGAGHDYASIAEKNFRMMVVERAGLPLMIPREEYLGSIAKR